ncbi:hypothetical protein Y710_18015 [Gordonia sp. QH-12]|uniref:hypothetical protein n=1 Tax=Gordonia sp. QH-12 TaxID=1437876 RepID=UPI0007807300|nr:hypothetical protein [Gordonia sp. QH-12]KXT55659.1 hypothetical protein Y710_18015 [Gordonia sp. QH-12]
MATAPARTAPKARWAKFLNEQGIDVPDSATRADMIDLWRLNQDDHDGDVDAPAEAGSLEYFRPAPDERLADQVPGDLSFSTDSGERRDPEKLLISIDGKPTYLYQPSTALLMLVAGSLSAEAPIEDRLRTMLNLVSQCLDSEAERLVRARMFARDNSFDDGLLGKLVATIINKWAPYTLDAADLDTSSKPKASRQQRRAAARAK